MQRDIEIIENERELTILIPRTGNWVVIVTTGAWSFVWIGSLYNIIRGEMLFRDPGFTIFIVMFSLTCLFVLKTFLWHLRGVEKIILDQNHLKISKLGTFLTSTRKFETNLIDDFRFTEEDNVARWIKLYGFAGGKIAFDHWERPEYFGQTVSEKEAKLIASRINERLKTALVNLDNS
jgi:hypothetical protein